jgi:hypothetical protein
MSLDLTKGQAPAGQSPGENPGRVGVDHTDLLFVREREHRSGRVGPDAREGE